MVLARDTPPADRSIPVLHCRGADRRQARQCFGVSAGPWLSRPLVYWPSASRGSPAHLLPPPAAQGSHPVGTLPAAHGDGPGRLQSTSRESASATAYCHHLCSTSHGRESSRDASVPPASVAPQPSRGLWCP